MDGTGAERHVIFNASCDVSIRPVLSWGRVNHLRRGAMCSVCFSFTVALLLLCLAGSLLSSPPNQLGLLWSTLPWSIWKILSASHFGLEMVPIVQKRKRCSLFFLYRRQDYQKPFPFWTRMENHLSHFLFIKKKKSQPAVCFWYWCFYQCLWTIIYVWEMRRHEKSPSFASYSCSAF